jgi:hypothetical protein
MCKHRIYRERDGGSRSAKEETASCKREIERGRGCSAHVIPPTLKVVVAIWAEGRLRGSLVSSLSREGTCMYGGAMMSWAEKERWVSGLFLFATKRQGTKPAIHL